MDAVGIRIKERLIGPEQPTYIVAELSANHNQDFDQAVRLVAAAKRSGADAVKLQTYTPDTITINCDKKHFQISGGTPWDDRSLYDLYSEAYTPWDWQPKLKAVAEDLGIDFFSTAFDSSSVDFLEDMGVPIHKIASFEIVDIPLIRKVANTGKPLIFSTGMATLAEIEEAVKVAREAGAGDIALMKCTSAYPAEPQEMNLRTIPHLSEGFHVPVGLSDHSLGIDISIAAVALGACIIEKHLTLSRDIPGPDSVFSLEPSEFKALVVAVRNVEKALGKVHYGVKKGERSAVIFRKSLFVVRNMRQGEQFTRENVRSIRPGHGLHTRYLEEVLGRKARTDIEIGTPLDWSLVY